MSKYTLGVLDLVGINVGKYGSQKYGAHSTRGASISKAKGIGVPLNAIMHKAAWQNASSFVNFYDRPDRFGQALLAEAHEKMLQEKRKHRKDNG